MARRERRERRTEEGEGREERLTVLPETAFGVSNIREVEAKLSPFLPRRPPVQVHMKVEPDVAEESRGFRSVGRSVGGFVGFYL